MAEENSLKLFKLHKAEIVITNDLKFAVAIDYSPGKNPFVILKGKNKIAEKIIWASQEIGIPLIENLNLEEESFNLLKEGQEIPEKIYKICAQSLALIYKTKLTPTAVKYIKIISKGASIIKKEAISLIKNQSSILIINPVSIELGSALFKKIKFLNEPLINLRQKLALELGVILPPFKIIENNYLKGTGYIFKIKEITYLESELEINTIGYDNILNIINKLKNLLYINAYELLSYTDVETRIEELKKQNIKLAKKLFPKYFSIASLKLILKNLLKEQISIRDLTSILEIIWENLSLSSDPELLTEFARMRFKNYLCQKYQDQEGFLNVILLGSSAENLILNSLKTIEKVQILDIKTEETLNLLSAIETEIKKAKSINLAPILICSPNLRRFLRRITEYSFPQLQVFSYNEIAPMFQVRTLGTINL